ncbi:MAG: cytochrome b/b6 domain-containing protein [Chloroflexota bacterium]
MSAKQKYRPLWVSLHWLMALLIFITFGIGLASLSTQAKGTAGGKLIPLSIHIILGIAILVIVLIRYILRMLVFAKRARRTGSATKLVVKKAPFLDQLSVYVHPLLYLLTALMAVLGIAIALPANLFTIIWFRAAGSPAAAIPTDFYVYPARVWHGTLSLLLMLLIVQHVLVAIFHQFLKGENFLGRMWFTLREK